MAELPLRKTRRLLHRLVWKRTGWRWAYSPSTDLHDTMRDTMSVLACTLKGHPHD